MKLKTTLLIFLTLFTTVSFAQAWKVYPYTPSTTPTSQISFPTDEGRHSSEPVEWW